MKFLNSPGVPQAPSTAASGVRVSLSDCILVSGQVSWDADGHVVGVGDIRAQANKAFENLEALLALGGADMSDIVKLNIYLTDESYRVPAREVRKAFLGDHRPPSTTVIVQGLVDRELMIEVDAVAVVGSEK
jgi:enamine deaminase RidA (YjgF/YER057c/UK114 family)